MRSIETKYLPRSTRHGARIRATASSGETLTFPVDLTMGEGANHSGTACALALKHKWYGRWCEGAGRTSVRGYVYVCADNAKGFTLREPRVSAAEQAALATGYDINL